MIIIGINWYINKYNLNNKLFGDRFANFLTFRQKLTNFNNKLYITFFIINLVVLIYILCFQLYISYELNYNLEDYINVHKFIKNQL